MTLAQPNGLGIFESLTDRTSKSAKEFYKLLKEALKADLDMNENEVLANLSEVEFIVQDVKEILVMMLKGERRANDAEAKKDAAEFRATGYAAAAVVSVAAGCSAVLFAPATTVAAACIVAGGCGVAASGAAGD